MIAAYLRVSSDTQDVARQRDSIEGWAEREGLVIDRWFEDSEGRNPRDKAAQRVAFQNMLEAVRAGMLTKIIVDSQDRFGVRDAYQFGEFLTLLNDNGCELWSVNQGHLTANDDATVLTNTIGALTSTREQKEKATRNISGKIQAAKEGEYQGGYPAYGIDVACFAGGREKWRVQWSSHHERQKVYPDGSREDFNGKNNFPAKDANDTLRYRPSLDDGRLEVVRSVFQWFATEDVSSGQIATRLNKLGHSTTVGTPWNKVIVRAMLANPVYVGLPAWNKRGGSRFKEYVGGQVQDVTEKAMGRPRDASDYVQPERPEFEPIVDAKTWQAVQAKLEAATQSPRRAPQVANLWLKPFLLCGRCGKPMRARSPQPRMEFGSYFCGSYGTYGKDNPTGCRFNQVKHSVLEGLVDKYLAEAQPQVADMLVAAQNQDSALFDMAYDAWSTAVTKRNRLWTKMAATVEVWPEDWWNIGKAYRPSDAPELTEAIAEKEAELDSMLTGFFKLSPALQDRANEKMEALQAEIAELKQQVEDLREPWADAEVEAYRQMEAMRYAVAVAEEDGPKRAEALRGVIDKIVCHYDYSTKKAKLDAVEIYPVSGDFSRFPVGAELGPD